MLTNGGSMLPGKAENCPSRSNSSCRRCVIRHKPVQYSLNYILSIYSLKTSNIIIRVKGN